MAITKYKKDSRATALKLFRVLNGTGDGGSEFEFDCQNPTRKTNWLKVAKMFNKEHNARLSHEKLIASIKATNPPLKSLSAIIEEVTRQGEHAVFHDDSWNENATIEISLRIREIRRINEFVECLKTIYSKNPPTQPTTRRKV